MPYISAPLTQSSSLSMTVYEIVNTLATNREVEKMIQNITDGVSYDPTALDDLAQDIYISLMGKGDKLIEVWEQGHINFYLSRIVCNNIMSNSSPYYRNYIYPQKLASKINENMLNKGE